MRRASLQMQTKGQETRRRVEGRMGEFGQGTRGQEKREEKDGGMNCVWRK